ncbi:tetratricopeptide repeat protein [Candidatus Chloroploca sp. Khr17]|uniref:ATP-binding protein n=1 Tax=Candidatus Chloroploca sp. Khr17 TaxID=2496869 RepID=UPI00101D9367|nr:tetratricopeptide repeat protein [Candidatus Chloroploca sp. Khr17]
MRSIAPAIAAICVRLEGLPLALELAAARIAITPPEALLHDLDQQLAVLVDGPLDLPARQRTLRDALAWSYQRLSGPEQALFACLGIFGGGCSLELATEVGAALPTLDRADLVELTAMLVARNMLRCATSGPTPRYTMLESLRALALEHLTERKEHTLVAAAFANAMLALAERAHPHLRSPDQATWLALLEGEHANLRAALRWLLTSNEVNLAARLGAALWRFWYARGHWSEGRTWLAQILALQGHAADATLAQVLEGAGMLAVNQTAFAEATSHYEACLALRRRLGDERGVSIVLNSLGVLADMQGDYQRAAVLHRENLAVRRSLNDQRGIATALSNLGIVANELGNHTEAATVFRESLAIHRATGDPRGIGIALGNLGMAALYQGDYYQADSCFAECLKTFEELGHRAYIAVALNNRGLAALYQGEAERAAPFFQASLTHYRDLSNWQYAPSAIEGLAAVATLRGQPIQAARLFGAAAAMRTQANSPLTPAERERYDSFVALTQAQLTAPVFASAWTEGEQLNPTNATALALEEPNDTR